jgi:hypothetical protein
VTGFRADGIGVGESERGRAESWGSVFMEVVERVIELEASLSITDVKGAGVDDLETTHATDTSTTLDSSVTSTFDSCDEDTARELLGVNALSTCEQFEENLLERTGAEGKAADERVLE